MALNLIIFNVICRNFIVPRQAEIEEQCVGAQKNAQLNLENILLEWTR